MKTYDINKGSYLVQWEEGESGSQQRLLTIGSPKSSIYEAYFHTEEEAHRFFDAELAKMLAEKDLIPVNELDFSPTDEEYRTKVTHLELARLIADEDGEYEYIEEIKCSEAFWIE